MDAKLDKPQAFVEVDRRVGLVHLKVENLETGDTLCESGNLVALEPVAAPEPMVALAVNPKTRGDEQKLAGALRKLPTRT